MKAVLLLTLSLITSSVSLPGIARDKLFGEWRYADQIQSCQYVFKKDGTFSGEVIYHGKILSRFKGKWSVKGDALFYEYTADLLGKIPVGSRDRDTLLVVEKNFFLIEAADGSKRKYVRIK